MPDSPGLDAFDVVCPHCKKPFTAEKLGASDSARQGFKCPHCRLFVPLDRVDERLAGTG